jgi:hypothetical protein
MSSAIVRWSANANLRLGRRAMKQRTGCDRNAVRRALAVMTASL